MFEIHPMQNAINYTQNHDTDRQTLTTTSGSVTLTTPTGKNLVNVIATIQPANGDTTGRYAWCLAHDFDLTTGGQVLVYDMTGSPAPDGTRVILWCEVTPE